MTPKVEIYTWSRCPFCIRAKALLNQKGIDHVEYCIDGDEEARYEMARRSHGRRSLPQIFINDRHIGGCDDLFALDAEDGIEPMLETSSVAG